MNKERSRVPSYTHNPRDARGSLRRTVKPRDCAVVTEHSSISRPDAASNLLLVNIDRGITKKACATAAFVESFNIQLI